jgi:hypothetical protein
MSSILSSMSSRFFSVSIRVRSTPESISLITRCRGVACGKLRKSFKLGIKSVFTNSKNLLDWSTRNLRLSPFLFAQSRQRYGDDNDGMNAVPWSSAYSASRSSRKSSILRNNSHVSSGTYCIAPAQLDRRIISQIALISLFSVVCFFLESIFTTIRYLRTLPA